MELTSTPPGWLTAVLGDFDTFLCDHASCEKKASGMALNIAAHYPDKPDLLVAMSDLAVEELSHYREVIRLLIERGVKPAADQRDPYVRALNSQIRQGSEAYLLDRLLVGAIVERRGSERFGLIAEALSNTGTAQRAAEAESLAAFYRAISASESRHWQLFIDLARTHCPESEIKPRLAQLIAAETRIMLEQPYRPALH